MSEHEVIVAGGGPVGLWLAAELALAGVDAIVLERNAKRPPHSKALTVYPRTLEHFAMRGITERWLSAGTPVPSSHFALLSTRLDFSFLKTRYPYTLFFPQTRTEELLEEHATSLGVRVLRGHTVTEVRQDGDGVTVDTEAKSFRAQYAVGCEGGSSVVRKSAGIAFEGSDTTLQCVMGDVEVGKPPDLPAVTLNNDRGSFYMVRLGKDLFRMAPLDLATLHHVRSAPPTLDELRASVVRVAGTDYGMHTAHWLTRVGNATLLASRYRNGRHLLAGDAAHLFFPLGGQGLNLGLHDASNLAWKLAADLHGRAPPELLDSYESERRPIGEDVVDDTLAQMALVSNTTREGQALRKRFDHMLGRHTTLNRELAVRLSGIATAYSSPPGAHTLTGHRVPDLALAGAPAASVYGLLTRARFVLLDLTGGKLQLPATDHLDVTTARLTDPPARWSGLKAMLIRPDGHLAWTTEDEQTTSAQAQAVLPQWLGPAAT